MYFIARDYHKTLIFQGISRGGSRTALQRTPLGATAELAEFFFLIDFPALILADTNLPLD
jgi:hypothetical protein